MLKILIFSMTLSALLFLQIASLSVEARPLYAEKDSPDFSEMSVKKIESDCTDRKDNDEDGFVDCSDKDCFLEEACRIDLEEETHFEFAPSFEEMESIKPVFL